VEVGMLLVAVLFRSCMTSAVDTTKQAKMTENTLCNASDA
jgi:hypothetical protein